MLFLPSIFSLPEWGQVHLPGAAPYGVRPRSLQPVSPPGPGIRRESMPREWEDFMKVGIVHFMAFPATIKGEGPIVETLESVVKDEFFQAVEVTWMKDEKVRQEAKKLLANYAMEVYYGAQPPLLIGKLNLNAEDDSERDRAGEQVKACIDEAIFLGAKGIAVLTGRDPGEERREKAKAQFVRSFEEICDYAQSQDPGLQVVLETFDRAPYGKNCLLGPTREAVEVCQEIRKKHSSFGLMIDLSHLPLLGETPRQCLEAAGDCLRHVHIGNCVMKEPTHPAYGDEYPPFSTPAGENKSPQLRELLQALIDTGYLNREKRPVVSFKVKPFGDWTSEKTIEDAKNTLEEAWKGIKVT